MKDNTRQPIFNYKCGVGKANMRFISNHKLKKKKFNKTVQEKSDTFMTRCFENFKLVFTHSVNILQVNYYVSNAVLGARDRAMNECDKVPVLMQFSFQWERQTLKMYLKSNHVYY